MLLPMCEDTGQEGFEPPTYGFGVRRSTVRATALVKTNPYSLVKSFQILPPVSNAPLSRI